jgi:cytochrome P450
MYSHETTSSAFSWTCYLLGKHTSIQDRLRKEIHSAFPSGISHDTPQSTLAATLDSLTYLNAVCNEVLRFYPTVPLTARVATTPTTICDIAVPAGTFILICPWAINRNPDLWGPDAGVFNPDRWIDAKTGKANNEGGVSNNYVNLTFLHGPRSCIGQNFAKAELRALVAVFVSRLEFVMQRPNEEIEPAGVITTKPRGGVHLKLRKVGQW